MRRRVDHHLRVRVAPPAEAGRLLAALEPDERAVWATAFYAGLRVGELLALDWRNVDLKASVIRVERAYDPKERAFVDVKSTASERRVPSRARCVASCSSTGSAAAAAKGSCSAATPRRRSTTRRSAGTR